MTYLFAGYIALGLTIIFGLIIYGLLYVWSKFRKIQNQINDFELGSQLVNGKQSKFLRMLDKDNVLPKKMFDDDLRKMSKYISKIREEN